MNKVKDISHLRQLIDTGVNDFYIGNGLLKSSKFINKGSRKDFYVFHLIDGHDEELWKDELLNSSIGQSIQNGNFYYE